MYPTRLQSIFANLPKFYYQKSVDGSSYCIRGTDRVIKWITEACPTSTDYQGYVIITAEEFMMLVLKFGPGEEEKPAGQIDISAD